MAAFAFPTGTTVGELFEHEGQTWAWNGGQWVAKNKKTIFAQDTEPEDVIEGNRWLNTENGKLYFRTQETWVQPRIM